MSTRVNETITGGGPGTIFTHHLSVPATLTILAMTGAGQMEGSWDDGVTWSPLGTTAGMTSFTGPVIVQFAPVSGMKFRFNQTSGTGARYRVDV